MEPSTISVIDPSWAAIIAALGALFTAIGGVVMAVSVLVPTMRASKAAVEKVEEVHQLVNDSHTALLQYQARLVGALRDADMVVPTDHTYRPVEVPPGGPGPGRHGLPDESQHEQGLVG